MGVISIRGEHHDLRVTIPVCHTHAGNATPQQVARESSAAHAAPSFAGRLASRFGHSLRTTASDISERTKAIGARVATRAVNYCTEPFGLRPTARSRTDGTFTTSTVAKTTIGSKTSSLFHRRTTVQNTPFVLPLRSVGESAYQYHNANGAPRRYLSIIRASNAARSLDQPAIESGFAHPHVTPNSGLGSAATRVDSSIGGP